MSKVKQPTIMVSGGFDPLHGGHAKMIQHASAYGDVIVVVNSDDWLMRKKGYVFMPIGHRCSVAAAIKGVKAVYPMKSGWMYNEFGDVVPAPCFINDDDDTACDAIQKYRPTMFANGGDRTQENVPEQAVCDEVGTELLWRIGGDHKLGSSSDFVQQLLQAKQ